MKKYYVIVLLFVSFCSSLKAQETVPDSAYDLAPEKNRLVILADMGNEPDEEQQIVHMLMYANEFDIEGLIAVTGKYLRENPQPELLTKLIKAYGKVEKKLRVHADGWPSEKDLHSVVRAGQSRYGIEDTMAGRKSSPGSKLIEQIILKDDSRPVYIVVNAGANTLAQALLDLEATLDKEQFDEALSKLRVFENGSQDNAGAWICARYKTIRWIRSNYQTYCYGGPVFDMKNYVQGSQPLLGPHTWEPYAYSALGQHQWAMEHIKCNHGPLGRVWPIRQFHSGGVVYLEGGGTIPWLGLVNKGLYDINHPHWGGWSGLFTRSKKMNYWSKHKDIKVDEEKVAPFHAYIETTDRWTNPENGKKYENSLYSPIWRWRRAFFNDFVCRMDWCVKSFKEANHNPVATVNGDATNAIKIIRAKAGAKLSFDASASSDPDGDELAFRWFNYKEAGTYASEIKIVNSDSAKIEFAIPQDAQDNEIHLILEVQDNNKIASLFDYRRIVISVE